MIEVITNILGGLGSFIADTIMGLLSGVVVFATDIVEALGGIIGFLDAGITGIGKLITGFTGLLSSLFPFIPAEWIAIVLGGIMFAVFAMIIRKKLF